MTCKDCVHFDVCDYDGTTSNFADGRAEQCRFFEEKSLSTKLPCKIGDTFYTISMKKCTVFSFKLSNFFDEIVIYVEFNNGYIDWFLKSEIGITVFFSREDARKALDKRKDGMPK